MEDWKIFIKNLISSNYFHTKITNPDDVSSPIVRSIATQRELLEEGNDLLRDILDKKPQKLPKPTDLSPVITALEDIKKELCEKEEKINVTLKII